MAIRQRPGASIGTDSLARPAQTAQPQMPSLAQQVAAAAAQKGWLETPSTSANHRQRCSPQPTVPLAKNVPSAPTPEAWTGIISRLTGDYSDYTADPATARVFSRLFPAGPTPMPDASYRDPSSSDVSSLAQSFAATAPTSDLSLLGPPAVPPVQNPWAVGLGSIGSPQPTQYTQYAGGQASPNYPPCPTIPAPGLGGAELANRANASAERASLRARDFFSVPGIDNRLELFWKSVPGARNDTKAYVPGSSDYGNFLFGAESAAAGLGLPEALNWGAKAQVVQDALKGQMPTGRDNPGDPDLIARGYRYYQAGCTKK